MQPGMIGLGPMGANMVRRSMRGGHACVVLDRSAAAVQALVQEHAVGAALLAEFIGGLARPRAIWLMVPAVAVDDSVAELLTLVDAGDAPAGARAVACHENQDSLVTSRGRAFHWGSVDRAAMLSSGGFDPALLGMYALVHIRTIRDVHSEGSCGERSEPPIRLWTDGPAWPNNPREGLYDAIFLSRRGSCRVRTARRSRAFPRRRLVDLVRQRVLRLCDR